MTQPPPLRYVVLGGGTAGWMAAATLARLAGAPVTLVESEAIGTVGVGEATIPQIRLFNAALGIDEDAFLRATGGSYKLGIAFEGWSGEGSAYMHAFGPVGRGAGVLPFHHYWLRARAEGASEPLSAYSANELAARAGKAPPRRGPVPAGPQLPYAYHFDAGLFAGLLRVNAEAAGAQRVEGRIAGFERDGAGGHVPAAVLDDGRLVEGDFFIDCTGFRALLIEGELGAGFESWNRWLRCDRAVAVPCAARGAFTPFTRSIARAGGWQWRIPLQHRVGNGYVYSSQYLSDDGARDTLLANLDGEPAAEPRVLRFTSGMRQRQWVGNCVAVGLAAGFMEPLESTSIHLVQTALARLLQMLPGTTQAGALEALAASFNRQAAFEWSAIRDFLVLHYWANARHGEAFWDDLRALGESDLPPTLAEKLAAFREGGVIARTHDELFTEEGWLQVLIGQGILPARYNPVANAMPAPALARMMADLRREAGGVVSALPDHEAAVRAALAPSPKRSIVS